MQRGTGLVQEGQSSSSIGLSSTRVELKKINFLLQHYPCSCPMEATWYNLFSISAKYCFSQHPIGQNGEDTPRLKCNVMGEQLANRLAQRIVIIRIHWADRQSLVGFLKASF